MDAKTPQYKGTNILQIHKRLLAAGKEQEEQFRASLLPEDLAIYLSALNIGWYPIEHATRIFTLAGKILYAQDPRPLRALGKDQALDNLNGIYRIILKVVDPGFGITQSARFWKTHFDRGEAEGFHTPADASGRQQGTLVVRKFPELPPPFIDIIEGYLLGGLEFTRGHILDSQHDTRNPEEWRWNFGYRQ